MSLDYYGLQLDEQMVVGYLEDYYGFDFKRALNIFDEYREVLKILPFSAEENAELLMRAKKQKINGKSWLDYIHYARTTLKEISERSNFLRKIEKIKIRNDGLAVEFTDLDAFEQEIVETMMIAYRHSLDKSMWIMNNYILEFYKLGNYNVTSDEWAIIINLAYEKGTTLQNAINGENGEGF